MNELQKISKQSLAEEVKGKLTDYILKNNFRDGASFPREIDLAESLGVSRTVVREALSDLRNIGVIESRKKQGMVIRKVNPAKVFADCLPFLKNDKNYLDELKKFRGVLETGAVALAAAGRSEEDLRIIKEKYEAYSRLTEKASIQESNRADAAFHLAVLNASGNRLLTNMSRVIIDFFTDAYTEKRSESIAASSKIHARIYKAISEKDSDAAVSSMRKHLRLP